MKTLSLPFSAKIKRKRIAAHKAMAYAALHADSSLNVRLARYNNHMSKARALAGEPLASPSPIEQPTKNNLFVLEVAK